MYSPHKDWLWNVSDRDASWLQDKAAVVFDIDGVLSDASGRQHFLRDDQRDWAGFFDACDQDMPFSEHVDAFNDKEAHVVRVLLTGRPMEVQQKTVSWLERHRISWDLLIMRDFGNYTPAVQYKREMVKTLQRYGAHIVDVVDDDPAICAMYESLGLPVRYVHSGYYTSVLNPPL